MKSESEIRQTLRELETTRQLLDMPEYFNLSYNKLQLEIQINTLKEVLQDK